MKLKIDFHGVIFEYEKKPMQEGRFRRLCALVAAALYVVLAVGVTRLCGLLGFLALSFATVLVVFIDAI